MLIIGISLKLLDVTDVKVGNFLPALIFAPALVGIVSLVDWPIRVRACRSPATTCRATS